MAGDQIETLATVIRECYRENSLRELGPGRRRAWPRSLMVFVQSPEPTWWKGRTAPCEMSSDLQVGTMDSTLVHTDAPTCKQM